MFNVWINSLNAGSVILCALKDGSVKLNPFRGIFLKNGKIYLKQIKWNEEFQPLMCISTHHFSFILIGNENSVIYQITWSVKMDRCFVKKIIDNPYYIHPFIHIFCGIFVVKRLNFSIIFLEEISSHVITNVFRKYYPGIEIITHI